MNQQEAPNVLHIRERLGKPTVDETARYMRDFYPKIREARIQAYSLERTTLELFCNDSNN